MRYNILQWQAESNLIWDDENETHLAAHKVAPAEFEQLLNNDPVDMSFELIDNQERYRSVSITACSGSILGALSRMDNPDGPGYGNTLIACWRPPAIHIIKPPAF